MNDPLLDKIDELIKPVCSNCAKTLREDGPSPDFCSDTCQTKWKAAQIGVQLDRDYRPVIPNGLPHPPVQSWVYPDLPPGWAVQYFASRIFGDEPVAHFHLHADGTIEEMLPGTPAWRLRTNEECELRASEEMERLIVNAYRVPLGMLGFEDNETTVPFQWPELPAPQPWWRRLGAWMRYRFW